MPRIRVPVLAYVPYWILLVIGRCAPAATGMAYSIINRPSIVVHIIVYHEPLYCFIFLYKGEINIQNEIFY